MDAVAPMYGFHHHITGNFLNRDVRKILYRTRDIPHLSAEEKSGLTHTLYGITAFFKWFNGPEILR